MAEIAIPRTPTPGSKGSKGSSMVIQDRDPKYTSPLPTSSSDLTPPPSTQPIKQTSRMSSKDAARLREALPASPPLTSKPTPAKMQSNWTGPIPTTDQARQLPEPQLRDLVCELIPALSEARMVAAHAKLQHSLLSLEAAEAAQRAAVEHDMTRREVEVLQAGSPLRSRASPFPDSASSQAQIQRLLEVALRRSRQLEAENIHLQRRLKKAKSVIKFAEGKSLQLTEDNELLRLRIRQNREHVDAMRSSGSQHAPHTPRTAHTPSSYRPRAEPSTEPRMDSQNPFDALLFAGQVLNGEPASVPSTPTLRRPMKFNLGHTRGTHSLSSLPTTPDRQKLSTADRMTYTPLNQMIASTHPSFSAPVSQIIGHSQATQQEDRESTISASDEEAYTDEDIPASQASQAASNMLRRYAGPNPNASPTPLSTPRDRLVQAKLMGKLIKPGFSSQDRQERGDRTNEADRDGRSFKRARLNQGSDGMLGLGIAVWPSPTR